MIKASLISFLFPKVFSLYLLELMVILRVLVNGIYSVLDKNHSVKLLQIRKGSETLFSQIVVLDFFLKVIILLLSSLGNEEILFADLIYQFKIFLYFYIFLFLTNKNFHEAIGGRINKIILIHFCFSLLVLIYNLTKYSFSDLLWRSREFGGRFVGFTGSSINSSGFELVGSTANSIGILYLLLLVYFQNGKFNPVYSIVCILGILLSFSQGALVGLLLFGLYTVMIKLGSIKIILSIILLVFLLYLIESKLTFSVIDRFSANLEAIFIDGELPATILDRSTQFNNLFYVLAECPMGLFVGQLAHYISNCPETSIVESYFFDQLQSFGFAGFVLAFLKFIFFIIIIRKRSQINLGYFYAYWLVSNLFLNNTFETDFILMTIISITALEKTKYGTKFQKIL